jgi:Transposase zinc-ribbon domain/ISXO2-like transposase domain
MRLRAIHLSRLHWCDAVPRLAGGAQCPRSLGEFQSWFATDADCLDYLEWLRWPDGFVCPRCENVGGWRVYDGSFKCTRCKAQTAVTAGTLFDRRRTPLTVWFQVCWEFATAKDGVSALAVKRTLQIGSYQTAWAMLHRLRSVLIRPGGELLSGQVEVDETYIGGEEAGLAGGRAKGKKALVAVAVEVRSPKGFRRCRMRIIADGSARTLHTFITDNIGPRLHRDHRRMVRLPGHRQGRLPA